MTEIVITAERHSSTVLETPISITALGQEQLREQGIASSDSLARAVAGLSVRSAGPNQTEFEARGLASNGGASPTVGFYFNDIPISPAPTALNGKVVINPSLFDVDHVEVLRGPQGTLYGASSMGGTVRIVTHSATLLQESFAIDASGSYTDGGGPNSSIAAMANLPVNDALALRLVVDANHRSGFLDRILVNPFPADGIARGNVLAGPFTAWDRRVNTVNKTGERLSVLWLPIDHVKVALEVLSQQLRMGAPDEFDQPPGTGLEAHFEAFNIREPITDRVNVVGLTTSFDTDAAIYTSVTGFWNRIQKQTQDASESASEINAFPYLVPLPYFENDYTHQFSEELRVSSPEGTQRIRWVMGLYFSDLHANWVSGGAVVDPVTTNPAVGGNAQGTVFAGYNPYAIKQSAVFGDGTVPIGDHVKLSAGLRWVHYDSRVENNEWGYDFPGVPERPEQPTVFSTSASALTPRFVASYSELESLNTYASISKGFRPGGANQLVPTSVCPGGAPSTYGPDSVWAYEVGQKLRAFDGRLTANGAAYYNAWNHVQETLPLPCGYPYYDNAGNGRSYGGELEVVGKLVGGLQLALNFAYTNAAITRPTASLAAGAVGKVSSCGSIDDCSIPIFNVPKYSGSSTISYTRPVGGTLTWTTGASAVYVGRVIDQSYYPIVPLPAYSLLSLRSTLASNERWRLTIFGENLGNSRAQISANNTSVQYNIPQLLRISTVQPRTIGLEIDYRH